MIYTRQMARKLMTEILHGEKPSTEQETRLYEGVREMLHTRYVKLRVMSHAGILLLCTALAYVGLIAINMTVVARVPYTGSMLPELSPAQHPWLFTVLVLGDSIVFAVWASVYFENAEMHNAD